MFNTYIITMVVAFILSLCTWKKIDRKVIYIAAILLTGLVAECIVLFLKAGKIQHEVVYHIYIPVEYTLFALFLRTKTVNKKIDPFVLWSIPLYIIISISLSVFYYRFMDYPGLNFNIEGFFIIVWSVWLLNSFDEFEETFIFQKPVFWLCLGLIVFFAGNFIFTGYYNHLKNTDKKFADLLNGYINNGLNIFLYITMSISFICSHKTAKY
jgi:hypothetical protein